MVSWQKKNMSLILGLRLLRDKTLVILSDKLPRPAEIIAEGEKNLERMVKEGNEYKLCL